MSGQVWQTTKTVVGLETGMVAAGTAIKVFDTLADADKPTSCQVIWIHNADDTDELWYLKQNKDTAVPASVAQTEKMGRILPGETIPFPAVTEGIDFILDASANTPAYVAWGEQ